MHLRTSVFALQTPLVAAAEEGFFAAEGLSVSFEPTVSSTEQLRQLAEGTIDVAQTAADNIIGLAAAGPGGARIVHVADLGIDQLVVARRGVTSWDDVRGGRVAVDAAASGYAFVLYRMLEERGVDPGEYEVCPVGGPGIRLEQLSRGDADVGLLNPQLAARAAALGLPVLARAADDFPLYPNLVLATSEPTLRRHRPELAAYARAVDRAVRWAHDQANTGRAVELLMNARSCTEDEARRLYEDERALRTEPAPSRARVTAALQAVADLRARMGGGAAAMADYATFVADG